VPADGKQERVEDQTIGLASGRTVGFAGYGIADATAVLWCHGGPGSRLSRLTCDGRPARRVFALSA
jgi:hypothetical protein